MGPAAWAAIGRAMGLALARSLFTGPNNVVELVAKEIHKAIIDNDIEMANQMLKDMAFRHRKSYEEFIKKFSKDIPPDALKELSKY